ncbi:MAG: hypothetical protein RDU20_16360 [Desulfomonilaceae bacterium]|nr:hypothetical protein [Desulfomonilaceae bacterium]
MEYMEHQSGTEGGSESREFGSEDFECLNYYPGMLADQHERDEEFREQLFAMEFFGDAECFEIADPQNAAQ